MNWETQMPGRHAARFKEDLSIRKTSLGFSDVFCTRIGLPLEAHVTILIDEAEKAIGFLFSPEKSETTYNLSVEARPGYSQHRHITFKSVLNRHPWIAPGRYNLTKDERGVYYAKL